MTPDQDQSGADDPTRLIDAKIASLDDWRGPVLSRMRDLIRQADPEIIETVKWRKPSNMSGVPVWERAGIICTGEIYKAYVKLTFAKGASLLDPACLFNAGLEGNVRRAIDIRENQAIDEEAFQTIVRAAVSSNQSQMRGRVSRSS